jgi:hypothetical protein
MRFDDSLDAMMATCCSDLSVSGVYFAKRSCLPRYSPRRFRVDACSTVNVNSLRNSVVNDLMLCSA